MLYITNIPTLVEAPSSVFAFIILAYISGIFDDFFKGGLIPIRRSALDIAVVCSRPGGGTLFDPR